MKLIKNLLSKIPCKVIHNCDGDPYLKRWYLIHTGPISLFLHKFIRSDEDRALHDHPWNFLVIPVWRGYIEHSDTITPCRYCMGEGGIYLSLYTPKAREYYRCDACQGTGEERTPRQRRVYPIISTRYRKAEYRHRVELLPCKAWLKGPKPGKPVPMITDEAPAWSLFFRFRKRRRWGFWPNNIFKDAQEWWEEFCG